MTNRQIEELENKYLNKFYYFLKYAEDEMMYGFKTKETIKDDWFGKHNDIRDNRLYAVGVLLNDDFSGGDFKLYNPDEIILDKVIGNTYLFDVRIDHEITSILEGERYSLLWFLENEHVKIETNKLI